MPGRALHEPISKMIVRGSKIRWRCDVVQGHHGDVDLKRIAKARGGDYVLINRRPPCRIPGCPGQAIFEDWSRQWPTKLETITDADPAWWAMNQQRVNDLTALGWIMEMGKWVAPDDKKPAPANRSGPDSGA